MSCTIRFVALAFLVSVSCSARAEKPQPPLLKPLKLDSGFCYFPRHMLDQVAAGLAHLMRAWVANVAPVKQLITDTRYFCDAVMTEDEREELLYYEAQLADIVAGDIGRNGSEPIDKAVELYSQLSASSRYGAFASARLAQLALIEPYLMLCAVFGWGYIPGVVGWSVRVGAGPGFLDMRGGNIAVLVLCGKLLDAPDAAGIHKAAREAVECAEKRFGIDRD